jgi:hypothetical protein
MNISQKALSSNKKKLIVSLHFLMLLVIVTILFFLVHHFSLRMESKLVGNWEEKVWRYEKANKKGNYLLSKKAIDDEVVDLISKDLLIHKTEYWLFHPSGYLKLKKKGGEAMVVKWRLKGRGNLLKLKYNNKLTEYYQVIELKANHLVLFFENDVHTRGIVKIEFNRI